MPLSLYCMRLTIPNRMVQSVPQIFGKDAHSFNPDRWLEGSLVTEKGPSVGVYANLYAFYIFSIFG